MEVMESRKDFLEGLMVTAVEGGINYWCGVTKTVSNEKGDGYVSAEIVDEDGKKFSLNTAVLEKGLKAITSDQNFEICSEYRKDIFLANLKHDGGLIDAPMVDCVVQAGLFNELVYG